MLIVPLPASKALYQTFHCYLYPLRIQKYLIALRSQKFFIGRENGVFQQNRPLAAIQYLFRNGVPGVLRERLFPTHTDLHFDRKKRVEINGLGHDGVIAADTHIKRENFAPNFVQPETDNVSSVVISNAD